MSAAARRERLIVVLHITGFAALLAPVHFFGSMPGGGDGRFTR